MTDEQTNKWIRRQTPLHVQNHYILSVLTHWDSIAISERTSDSLNDRLPIKWPEKIFKKKKRYFSMQRIVGATLKLSAKSVFSHWTSTN